MAPSPSSSSQPWSSSPSDRWFLQKSHLDSQILTQALSLELSGSSDPSPSSPKSLAAALSHCLASRASWKTPDSQSSAAVVRALQQQGASAYLQQQQQHSHGESSNSTSNAASPMSSSDLKERLSGPGSPFNSPCANSNSAVGGAAASGESKPGVARAFLAQHESEDTKGGRFANLSAPRGGTIGAPSVKLEDGQGNAPWGPRTAAIALSAQAAAGAGAAKVSKRRSRATNKAPITVLSADATNFRAMVQKLTGIPSSPSVQQNGFQFWGASAMPVLKPHPTRPAQSVQGLPTLDTSAFLLSDGVSQGPRLLSNDNLFPNPLKLPFLQPSSQSQQQSDPVSLAAELGVNRAGGGVNQATSFSPGAVNSDLKALYSSLQANQSNLGSPLQSFWDSLQSDKLREECFQDKLRNAGLNERLGEGYGARGEPGLYQGLMGEGDQFSVRQSAAIESLLMGDDRSDMELSGRLYHPVDSWLSFDGSIASHAPKMELARMT